MSRNLLKLAMMSVAALAVGSASGGQRHGAEPRYVSLFTCSNSVDVQPFLHALKQDGTRCFVASSKRTGVLVEARRARHAARLLRKLPNSGSLQFAKF